MSSGSRNRRRGMMNSRSDDLTMDESTADLNESISRGYAPCVIISVVIIGMLAVVGVGLIFGLSHGKLSERKANGIVEDCNVCPSGPQGIQGSIGPVGPPGVKGDDCDCNAATCPVGPSGQDGLHCWDTDGNGVCTPSKDVNNDGNCDILDCQGPKGSPGFIGANGVPGINAVCDPFLDCTQGDRGLQGDQGESGLMCWDTNGNGICTALKDVNNDGECNYLDCQGVQGFTGDDGNCVVTDPGENFVFNGNVTVLGGFSVGSNAFYSVENLAFLDVLVQSFTVTENFLITGTTNITGTVQFNDVNFAAGSNITCESSADFAASGCVEMCPDFSTSGSGCVGVDAIKIGDIVVERKFIMELDSEVGINEFQFGTRDFSADNYSIFTNFYQMRSETTAVIEATSMNFTADGVVSLFSPSTDDRGGLIVIEGERKVVLRANKFPTSKIVADGDVEITGDLICDEMTVGLLTVDDLNVDTLTADTFNTNSLSANILATNILDVTGTLRTNNISPYSAATVQISDPIFVNEIKTNLITSPNPGSINFNTDNAVFEGDIYVGGTISNAVGGVVIDDDVTITGATIAQDDMTVFGNLVVGGSASVGGVFTCPSDRRLKHDIQPITFEESDEFLSQLDAVTFIYNDKRQEGRRGLDKLDKRSIGYIAQDSPESIRSMGKDGFYGVDYIGIIPHVVNRIKADDARITALEKKIASLLDSL